MLCRPAVGKQKTILLLSQISAFCSEAIPEESTKKQDALCLAIGPIS